MRHDKAAGLLHLARALAASAEGLTLDEMAAFSGDAGRAKGRRTAERMRDALQTLFPQLEEVADGPRKRFRIPGGLDGFMQAPTTDELAELRAAARALDAAGGQARAALLRALSVKVEAALRQPVRRRLAPDLDALALAEGDAMQAGPRPLADPALLAVLRNAVKAGALLRFKYNGEPRAASPWGLLYGRSYYLVGPGIGLPDPVLWRLDRMAEPHPDGPAPQPPPPGWSMADYAARSFGVFQEPPHQVALRFSPTAAADVARFLFHPTQVLTPQPDGALLVRFNAGGLLELVRHLFTWGAEVTIVEPAALRGLMTAELAAALAHHADAERA